MIRRILAALLIAGAAAPAAADPLLDQRARFGVEDERVIVQLSAEVEPTLPVWVRPLTSAVRAKRQVPTKVIYEFTNLSSEPQKIKAIHWVRPDYAESHFDKLVCFCFEEQTLAPNESRLMPVVFTLREDLPWDVTEVRLRYTIFKDDGRAGGQAQTH